MIRKTIIIDPCVDFENMQEVKRRTPEELDKFNRSQPEIAPLTEEDERDLEEMFLEDGLLKEVFIH